MRTIAVTLYTFEELPTECAKERARAWWRNGMDFSWQTESKESITAFCDHFGARLTDWEICAFGSYSFKVDAPASLFRGVKLKDIQRDAMPTGYCLDCSLWFTFYDTFKATGCATKAFHAAIEAGFRDWLVDMESQLEDEQVDEMLVLNEYEFDENGNRA